VNVGQVNQMLNSIVVTATDFANLKLAIISSDPHLLDVELNYRLCNPSTLDRARQD
jgi:hypothetical protein